jgi:hypothetical protein
MGADLRLGELCAVREDGDPSWRRARVIDLDFQLVTVVLNDQSMRTLPRSPTFVRAIRLVYCRPRAVS